MIHGVSHTVMENSQVEVPDGKRIFPDPDDRTDFPFGTVWTYRLDSLGPQPGFFANHTKVIYSSKKVAQHLFLGMIWQRFVKIIHYLFLNTKTICNDGN